ncbi:hypothetical protein [Oscillibacter sp. CU971]|uniref:hypothetical protein n=1 Tax=Oscillibacter sp. CU971 TaxID=2780102 RepID=UPI001958459D|nr:hypothetical protein [Oscillibacter sp. CU971]
MIPISSSSSRPAAAPALQGAERTAKTRPASQPASKAPLRPVKDEYVPEEKQASYGRYWLGKDEDGSPKIYFDDPEAAEDAPVSPEAPKAEYPDGEKEPMSPEKAGPPDKGGREEKCVSNTDAVDREIRKLKEKKEKLEAKLDRETDETKRGDLERQLAQVDSELSQKDNDAYRRQHTKFTNG